MSLVVFRLTGGRLGGDRVVITVQQVWAVVRVDTSTVVPSDPEGLASRVYVKEILLQEDLAISEVARLNELNSAKGVYYFYAVTRLRDRVGDVIPAPNS